MSLRFTFQGCGENETLVKRYDGNIVTSISVPNDRLRELGENMVELADAQDALSEFLKKEQP